MTIHVVQGNPGVDRIEVVDGFEVGAVNRSTKVVAVAGGKGLNVARALRRLGHPVAAYGLLGGATGAFIREACTTLGIGDRHVGIEGDTRVCAILVDRERRQSTVVNEPGPTVRAADERALFASVVTHCLPGDFVVMAGSLAAGLQPDVYGRLVAAVQLLGAHAVVDASGESLRLAIREAPWMVKANVMELAEVGVPVEGLSRALRGQTEWMIATSGAEGALARSRSGAWRVSVPQVEVVNATGAGDVFLAALLSSLVGGEPIDAALRFATAAAAGSVTQLEPELPDPATIAAIRDHVQVVEA
jgi:1-phosphofructokinase family hexose kinase